MLTVAILINGNPIMARSANNTGDRNGSKVRYLVDDGSSLWHDPEDGAVSLAERLLGTIKEQGVDKKPTPRKRTKTKGEGR